MKVFRENGYFMLILANGHHGVLQSFVKHLSVAVIFLQSCPLARAISRRRKKIWKRSLSLVSSHHHRRRFKLTCRKRSVAFDKSRHQQSTKYRMMLPMWKLKSRRRSSFQCDWKMCPVSCFSLLLRSFPFLTFFTKGQKHSCFDLLHHHA